MAEVAQEIPMTDEQRVEQANQNAIDNRMAPNVAGNDPMILNAQAQENLLSGAGANAAAQNMLSWTGNVKMDQRRMLAKVKNSTNVVRSGKGVPFADGLEFAETIDLDDLLKVGQTGAYNTDKFRRPILPKVFSLHKSKTYNEEKKTYKELFGAGSVLNITFKVTNEMKDACLKYIKSAGMYPAEFKAYIEASKDSISLTDVVPGYLNKYLDYDDADAAADIAGVIRASPHVAFMNVVKDARNIDRFIDFYLGADIDQIGADVGESEKQLVDGIKKFGLNWYPIPGGSHTGLKVQFLYGRLEPTFVLYKSQQFNKALHFYSSRGYRTWNQKIKLTLSPMQINSAFLDKYLGEFENFQCQTQVMVRYDDGARKKLRDLLVNATTKDLDNFLKDRIISLEPEMRGLDRFVDTLDNYDTAKERWSKYHKGSKPYESVLSREKFDQAKKMLKEEFEQLQTLGNGVWNADSFEWPTAKIPYLSFVRELYCINYINPIMRFAMSQHGNFPNNQGATFMPIDSEEGFQFYIDSLMDDVCAYSYSLTVKRITQKTLSTPMIDRIQFSKNMKYTTYLALANEGAAYTAEQRVTKKTIGIIIKKKRRLQLQAMIDQSGLSLQLIKSPMLQCALRFFSVIDSTSLNIRRMITFAVYQHIASHSDNYKIVLSPITDCAMPRYEALKKTSSAPETDALNNWHRAYKLLAESHIRRKLQRSTKKVFKLMKQYQKAINRISVNKSAFQGPSSINLQDFFGMIDPEAAVMMTFAMNICCAVHPPFIEANKKLRGFTGTNILAAQTVAALSTTIMNSSVSWADTLGQVLNTCLTDEQITRLYTSPYGDTSKGKNTVPTAFINLKSRPDTQDTIRTLTTYDTFQRYFFPGVSSLLYNSLDGTGNTVNSLFVRQQAPAETLSGRIVAIRLMSVAYELLETGIMFLQQYNTAYFKGISDESMCSMVLIWFEWTILTISRLQEVSGRYFSNDVRHGAVTRILSSLKAIAQFCQLNLRPLRPDKISNKIGKEAKDRTILFPTFVAITGIERGGMGSGGSGDKLQAQVELAKKGEVFNLHFIDGSLGSKNALYTKLEEANRIINIKNQMNNSLKANKGISEQQKLMIKQQEESGLLAVPGLRSVAQDIKEAREKEQELRAQAAGGGNTFQQIIPQSNQGVVASSRSGMRKRMGMSRNKTLRLKSQRPPSIGGDSMQY